MNKIDFIKKTVTVIVGFGVSKIVNDVIANNVAIDKPHQKVTVPVAAIAIGGVVADASSNYTDALIDDIVIICEQIKSKFDQK